MIWDERPTEMKIEVRNCECGRGIFCTSPIIPEETVEICPFVKTTNKEIVPPLNDYIFSLPDPDQFKHASMVAERALAGIPIGSKQAEEIEEREKEEFKKREIPVMLMLGFGAVYNHSDHPNLQWSFLTSNPLTDNVKEQYIVFRAYRHIMPNQELTISYGEAYWRERSHLKKIDL
jgi:hypothetical protein